MKILTEYKMVCFGLLLFGFCLFPFITLAANDTVVLKKGAPPEIIAVDGKAKLLYGEFIRRRLKGNYPDIGPIVVGDKRYMFITEKWFKDVIAWTTEFIDEQVPELKQRQELPVSYEETLVMLMSNMANLAVAKRYNVKASVLIGLVVVKNNEPWGKISADGKKRVYVIGLTENGALVYDVPTGQIISGKEFPNRANIVGILF